MVIFLLAAIVVFVAIIALLVATGFGSKVGLHIFWIAAVGSILLTPDLLAYFGLLFPPDSLLGDLQVTLGTGKGACLVFFYFSGLYALSTARDHSEEKKTMVLDKGGKPAKAKAARETSTHTSTAHTEKKDC